MAIVGDGWLSVETPQGLRYTRDGRLQLSPNSELTNVDGSPVLDDGGNRIRVPEEALNMTIARDGGVSIQIQGEPLPIEIARLGIYQFNDPQQLVREANGRFRSDTMEPIAVENARVEQFSIENSNINPIQEIVELLELSRAYTQVASASNDIHEQKKDSIKRLGTNT